MVHDNKLSFLKIKEGQFVTVRKLKAGLKLCAVDRQENEPSVVIWKRVINNKNQMAFSFHRGDDDYIPMVVGEDLQFEKISSFTSSRICEHHWFEQVNLQSGKHYGLRSVVEPNPYLSKSLDSKNKVTVFLLGASIQDCAELTDESAEASITS